MPPPFRAATCVLHPNGAGVRHRACVFAAVLLPTLLCGPGGTPVAAGQRGDRTQASAAQSPIPQNVIPQNGSTPAAVNVQPVIVQPVIVQPGAPGQPSQILPPSTRPAIQRPSPADTAFMQGMIMHHSQAVEMTALIPSHTQDGGIRLLGARISASQSDEMSFMKRWLAAHHQPVSMAMPGMPEMDMSGNAMPAMPGMLTPGQMDALRAARGSAFDHLFLTGMIQHHNGALVMVRDLFNTGGAGQDADLFDFATDADNTQRAEIRIMQGMLSPQP